MPRGLERPCMPGFPKLDLVSHSVCLGPRINTRKKHISYAVRMIRLSPRGPFFGAIFPTWEWTRVKGVSHPGEFRGRRDDLGSLVLCTRETSTL